MIFNSVVTFDLAEQCWFYCRSAWPWKQDRASALQKVNNAVSTGQISFHKTDEAVSQLVSLARIR